MQKTHKGMSKIFVLLLIIGILIISAIMFGYSGGNTDKIKSQAKTKAYDTINKNSEEIVGKVIDNSKETVGEKLIETGEKILDKE